MATLTTNIVYEKSAQYKKYIWYILSKVLISHDGTFLTSTYIWRQWECVRNFDLQVHPGELWVSKQRVHIVLEASKSAGAKSDAPKICGFVHPLHPCNAFPDDVGK